MSMATTSTSNKVELTQKPRSWRRWVEPWYLAYALQGATVAGLAPILLPLAVSRASSATYVGLVMAAFSLGGLTAPLWGGLADRYRLHRWLLAGGLLVTALGLGLASTVPGRSPLMDGFGLIAFASLFPMITVMGYAQISEWRAKRHPPN